MEWGDKERGARTDFGKKLRRIGRPAPPDTASGTPCRNGKAGETTRRRRGRMRRRRRRSKQDLRRSASKSR